MQKRVVYNFNAQTVAQTAAVHANGKAVKASNAIGKIKRAFSGKSLKLAVFVVLLFASLFCTIGSADWIISQQKNVPNGADSSAEKTFTIDEIGFDNYIKISNTTYNGKPAIADTNTTADKGARELPKEAVDVKSGNVKFRVKPYKNETSAQSRLLRAPRKAASTEESNAPAADAATNLPDESEFDGIDYTTELPKDAGTYAVLITSTVKDASSGKTISYGKAIKVFTIAPCPVNIEWSGAVGFTYDGADHAGKITATAKTKDGTVIKGIVDISYSYAAEPGATASAVTEVKNAGTYTATAKITNDNYVLAEGGKTEFKVLQKELTVKANPHQITYGDAPSTNGYEISGYANGETLESANISGTAKLTTNYTQFEKVGEYEIRVDISELSSLNYSFKPVNGILTVNKKELTVTAKNNEITYGDEPSAKGYEISGFVNNETPVPPNISGTDTVKLTTNYTQFKDVGKYNIIVDISGLSSPNYSFKAVNGILTVDKKELTVTANKNTITYGDEPSANGYKIEGFVNNDNESVVNGLENLTYIIDYAQWQDIGQFSITPKVDGLSAVNYSFKAKTGNLTVKQLDIQLTGIIERDYESGGIPYNKDLFSEATFTAPENPAIDLSQLKNIYQAISKAGNAQNFDNANGLDITAENGLFSYKFGEAIKAGSTYKIDSVTLNNKNLKLTKTEVYLKYQTAIIGTGTNAQFFTIEDALAAGGDITLCGNATGDSTYVITAFAKLFPLTGTEFANYKNDYKYTLSGKKLIVPFENSLTEKKCLNKTNAAYGNVYSALVIQNNISLNLSDSASITVAAELSYNQSISCALVEKHGVLSNNGTITAETGCTVSAYGYIKGTGTIILKNGAIGNDVVSIYDFPGGHVILNNMSKIFPTNAFTLHSNACETYIYSGAKYTGFTYFALSKLLGSGTNGYEATAEIVGANSSSGLFAPTSTSGYIVKKVTTLGNYDINNISATNQRTASNTKLQHRDNIEVYGSYKDNTMQLSVSGYNFQTSTDKPFPIGLMDITIKTGNLTLEKSSYMVMPGSKIKVENGAKLTVNGKAKLSAIKYDTINSSTGNYKYIKYFSTTDDGEIIVNGELTTASTAQVGGKILSTEATASIQLSNTSASYIMLIHSDKSNATLSGTVNAFGNIMTSQSSYAQQDFSTGTYYSTQIGSAYAWFKNTATITYILNGGTLNGTSGKTEVNVTLPSGGYTDLPEPTLPYYTFDGWYFDSNLTQKATAIYKDCTLYAKWTPIHYTIQYILPYTECGALANGSLSGNQEKELLSPPNKTIIVDGTTYVFLGWYLNSEYSGNSVASVSAVNADDSGFINVYAYYSGNSYTVTYEENPDNITFANNKTVIKPEAQNFSQGDEIPLASLRSLSSYNSDKEFDYYFEGWYLSTDSTETPISSLSNIIDGEITLCAKWIKKAQLKIEMPVFENGNRTGNTIVYDTHKYFYKQTTDEIGINNLSSYIGAVYTVPEGYKFIGFNASSGFTAKQNYSNMNDITTAIEVGETSNDLTITADIRKILTVTLEMDAESEEYLWQTAYFSIDNISIESNSIYSTDKSNWLFSDGTGNITPEKRENKELQKVVFYILEGNTFTVTINNVKIISRKYSVPEPATSIAYSKTTTNESCLFTFATVEGDTTVKWTGKGTRV